MAINWDLASEESKTGDFSLGGGDFDPIPANTVCKAIIEEAKWDDYDGQRYISLRWSVLQPVEYKNRKVFQKIRIEDADMKKQAKAVSMLNAINVNAKGNINNLIEPTDEDLIKNLVDKFMHILLQVWKIDDKQGNWVSRVANDMSVTKPKPQPQVATKTDVADVPF